MIIAMSPAGGWYLFCLGLAAGLAVLAMSAYLAVSPRWLRWMLLGCGMLMILRYLCMTSLALLLTPPNSFWLHRFWFGSTIGLTFPTLVALDQLVRHPAVTPRLLLRWYAPFFGVFLLVLLFGRIQLVSDPLIGLRPTLGWFGLGPLILADTVFVAGVFGLCAVLWRRLTSLPIRLALAGLLAAYAALAIDGLSLLTGGWVERPFLFSEMLALAALWAAFHIARLSQ
ncbi:MAG: hypothetical protein HYY15_03595 [Candidatus Omnitrophica bacterium]|nr:hypothetical protein [Candidatus Omnitrophota bacterium]